MDTGIDVSHHQFENRAREGPSYISDGYGGCHPHGTLVAGTVGGRDFVVGQDGQLLSVREPVNCENEVTWDDAVAAFDW
ncbi:hypothetical protein [Streptomyces albipurpureus]|uniref:hypothetical protein n=1 Tax=Streptomyces albipurpureus TaxID=2897419 RepID=UPI002033F0A3|nr:hypothetical protein [Streptomyces sp. CWNU-1]